MIFLSDAADKSIFKDAEETDSSALELVILNSIIGSSLSFMVYVWIVLLPRVALLGFDKVTITVSSPSLIESSIILPIVTVPLVSPALIVIEPLAKV